MEIIISFVAGALLVLLASLAFVIFMRRRWMEHENKISELNEKLMIATVAEARAMESKDKTEAHLTETLKTLETARESLRQMESEKVRAQTELKSSKEALESERKTLEEARERLQDAFSSLASKALEGNSKQFLQLAKSVLEQEAQGAKSELEKRQEAIRNLVNPLKEQLDRYQTYVGDIEKERQKSYTTVENELKRIVENSAQLSRETAALKDALKKPNVRGRWGEMQLKNCVELAGMSEFADVSFQDANTVDDQLLIPDMTVRMPGGHYVVVDAKTPIDAFLSSLESSNDTEREAELIRHGRHVKEHIKKLSTRAYGEALKDSADFTVMFLPNESFLYAALETQADLVEYALQKKVLIATPPTLIGLLKVIRFGWNEEKLAENAMMISEAGRELHKRVCDFVSAYVSVGKHLEKARAEYEVGLSRLESRVLVQARRLETLGAKSHKNLPEGMGNDEKIGLEPGIDSDAVEEVASADNNDSTEQKSAVVSKEHSTEAPATKKQKPKKRRKKTKRQATDLGTIDGPTEDDKTIRHDPPVKDSAEKSNLTDTTAELSLSEN